MYEIANTVLGILGGELGVIVGMMLQREEEEPFGISDPAMYLDDGRPGPTLHIYPDSSIAAIVLSIRSETGKARPLSSADTSQI